MQGEQFSCYGESAVYILQNVRLVGDLPINRTYILNHVHYIAPKR